MAFGARDTRTITVSASWSESWIRWRNRVVASPKFQRWAARSPLTRHIARRRARALFDLCAGFVYSQILHACVELDLFAFLAARPRSAAEVAQAKDLPFNGALRLLRAAAALKLFRALDGDRFALADLGAAMLGNPSIADFVAHHTLLYDDLRDPVALLRGQTTTKLSQFWPYAEDRPGQHSRTHAAGEDRDGRYAAYSDLMARSQALIAEDVLDAVSLTPFTCLLDVGGGEGVFAAAAARRAPNLKVKLFDLPPVAERARLRIRALGLEGRVQTYGGSFLTNPLPEGADIVSLIRVLHDHDDESALAILGAARRALRNGGSVLIAEPMAETLGAEPIGDAYFGFYLLAMGRGRARSAGAIVELLRTAGFGPARTLTTARPLLASAVISQRV
jgi:demethylspheroidene O-methyltransferase